MTVYSLLEFDKIKKIIREYSISATAKEKIENLKPLKNKKEIENRLKIVGEIKKITGAFNFEGFSNINPLLYSQKEDIVFDFMQFRMITKNVEIARNLIIQKKSLSEYGSLKGMIDSLYELNEISEKYKKIFNDKGEIKDNASEKLKKIRSSQKTIRKNILNVLDKEISHYAENNYLNDKIITQRNGRYVVPIKKNSLPYVSGMVLDSSSSGFTAYVEPAKVISLNNKLKLLSDEERYEIINIFSDFTNLIFQYKTELLSNQKILTELDFYQAIAKFANDFNAEIPNITSELIIDLKGARHPLLIKFYGDFQKVIPFDLKLDNAKKIMILSGPNTGGKTVTLKTVGLLTLMALSGLPITAQLDSTIGLFHHIFADIGDSQSLDQSLSTFSSHINNIKKMLSSGDEKSLILIDEIGSATDPEQGTALAYAILEEIIKIKAMSIITTHYTALKLFAEEHPDCFNASMVFDPDKHLPTYHLKKGIPGNSFALEIAESLGLKENVINRAKELLGKEHLNLNNILKRLSEERKHLSREIYKFKLRNALYQKKIEEYEDKLKELEAESKKKKEKLIAQTKEYLYSIQREVANQLEELKKQKKKDKRELEKIFDNVAEKNKKVIGLVEKDKDTENKKIEKPKVGMRVWLKDIEENGEITEITAKGIKVDVNGMYYTTNIDNIYIAKNQNDVLPKRKIFISKQVKTEINLLGNTFEEAFPKLLTFLDDAYLAGLEHVRIIHGKGTGALRHKIRNYLKSDSRIKSFKSADMGLGGDGVTEVEFIDDKN